MFTPSPENLEKSETLCVVESIQSLSFSDLLHVSVSLISSWLSLLLHHFKLSLLMKLLRFFFFKRRLSPFKAPSCCHWSGSLFQVVSECSFLRVVPYKFLPKSATSACSSNTVAIYQLYVFFKNI